MTHEWERYSRQMLFNPIGESGQKMLSESKVLIVGMGALGTVAVNHLARSGVGHIVFCDRDYVEASNLQRQSLFDEQDALDMLPKAVAAERKLKAINSSIQVEGIVTDVTADNIHGLMENVDIVMDGTDNFSTRYLLNDVAFQYGVPYIYGGVVSSRGMGAMFIPGETPCLRCLFPTYDASGQTCDTIGVLSMVVDAVASQEALMAVKYLTGNKDQVDKALYTMDMWRNDHFSMGFGKAVLDCPTCGKKEFPALQVSEGDRVTTLCGRETVQILHSGRLDLKQWASVLAPVVQEIKETPFLLKALLNEGETLVLFPDGRTLVQGTEDVTRAKTLFTKYIGS